MIELYFLLYRIPRMMTRLARERNRSALTWSLIAIGAWIGAELLVGFAFGLVYAIGGILFGWSEDIPAGVTLLLYILALGAAIGSLGIVRRILSSKGAERYEPLPPPPPEFSQD
jgi:uncharacterized integral membrane protein